jgi:hypothetical protein
VIFAAHRRQAPPRSAIVILVEVRCTAVAECLPLRNAVRARELLEHASVTGRIVSMCQE